MLRVCCTRLPMAYHVRRGQVVEEARRVRAVGRAHDDVDDAARAVEGLCSVDMKYIVRDIPHRQERR